MRLRDLLPRKRGQVSPAARPPVHGWRRLPPVRPLVSGPGVVHPPVDLVTWRNPALSSSPGPASPRPEGRRGVVSGQWSRAPVGFAVPIAASPASPSTVPTTAPSSAVPARAGGPVRSEHAGGRRPSPGGPAMTGAAGSPSGQGSRSSPSQERLPVSPEALPPGQGTASRGALPSVQRASSWGALPVVQRAASGQARPASHKPASGQAPAVVPEPVSLTRPSGDTPGRRGGIGLPLASLPAQASSVPPPRATQRQHTTQPALVQRQTDPSQPAPLKDHPGVAVPRRLPRGAAVARPSRGPMPHWAKGGSAVPMPVLAGRPGPGQLSGRNDLTLGVSGRSRQRRSAASQRGQTKGATVQRFADPSPSQVPPGVPGPVLPPDAARPAATAPRMTGSRPQSDPRVVQLQAEGVARRGLDAFDDRALNHRELDHREASVTDVDDLVRRLYEPLSRRLAADVWRERVRSGDGAGLRR